MIVFSFYELTARMKELAVVPEIVQEKNIKNRALTLEGPSGLCALTAPGHVDVMSGNDTNPFSLF
jgi:hypothetical protein